MRVLCLDIGEKTIGVAVSDGLGITAQGVTVIRRVGGEPDFEAVAKIAREYEAERIVYGLPINMDGTEGESAHKVRSLAGRIGAHTGLQMEPMDERLTTVTAQRVLIEGGVSRKKRKLVIDKVAAQVILQAWLDIHGGSLT